MLKFKLSFWSLALTVPETDRAQLLISEAERKRAEIDLRRVEIEIEGRKVDLELKRAEIEMRGHDVNNQKEESERRKRETEIRDSSEKQESILFLTFFFQ